MKPSQTWGLHMCGYREALKPVLNTDNGWTLSYVDDIVVHHEESKREYTAREQ